MKRKRFSTEQIVAVLKQAERPGGLGPDPATGDFRTDVFPLEEAIWPAAIGTGPGAEATRR